MNVAQSRARAFFLQCRPSWSLSSRARITPQNPVKWSSTTAFPDDIPKEASTPAQPRKKPDYRPFYVTTPIFYVNAEPHCGHVYSMVLADVLKRWQVLRGDHEAALITGTDEHGMKVQQAAKKAGVTPQEMCDKNSAAFLKLAQHMNISFDRFIRTTDQDHKDAVNHFWRELRAKGFIYESKHEGWYAVSDETFYPESQVQLILDPATGRKLYASIETGKEVEWTEEVNYHFKLSAFKDRLLQHYAEHPDFIVPQQRFNFIKREVEDNLQDLSVSRPSSRLTWGIPVPDDDSQTIYVWLDALINYITMTGYPYGTTDRHKLWPPNVQVIGKDIIRFHCIYWPAFLMALDLPLPRTFLSHAHWMLGRHKMSKSIGNVVDPFMATKRFGLDPIRFYMIHNGGIVDDASYENSFIVEVYKKCLQGGIGNMLSRGVRSAKWSTRVAVANAKAGWRNPFSDQIVTMSRQLELYIKKTTAAFDAVDPRLALHTIMDAVNLHAKFYDGQKPWTLTKEHDTFNNEELNQIIYASTELTRIVAILLQPFMPDKAGQILDTLEVQKDRRTFEWAKFGADLEYGCDSMHLKWKDRYENLLFPPLVQEW